MRELFKPEALLRPPMGTWAAVRIDRPDTRRLRYENLSDQFRLPFKRRPQELRRKKKKRPLFHYLNVSLWA